MTDAQEPTTSRTDTKQSPPEASPSGGWRETAEAMHVDAEPDPEDLSNEELLERVAELDPEKYPIAKRAEVALNQLEESSA